MGPARFFGYETHFPQEKWNATMEIDLQLYTSLIKKKKKKPNEKPLAFKYVLVIPLSLQADKKPLPEQVF